MAIDKIRGTVDVAIQDQSTDRISIFLAQILGFVTSMTGTDKDADTFNIVTDGVVPTAGNFLCLQEEKKISQEEITAVTPVAGNEYTVTIATPLDFDYTAAGSCSIQNVNLNIDGSVTEVPFEVGPRQGKWDITEMIVSMVMAGAGDDGLFGDIAALTNGQYFRKEDSGNAQNLFNAKENSDFALEGYDVIYTERTVPIGSHGMRARIKFNGLDNSGVVIRMDSETGDTFKSVVRDDLTGLTRYRIRLHGHVVEEQEN